MVQLDALVEALELRGVQLVVLEDDGELELGRAQHLGRLLGLALHEAELHLRMAPRELRDGGWQQRRARRGERREPHAAPADAGDRLELRLRRGEPRDHYLRVLDERRAGVGEPDAAATAVHERGPRAPLER